MLIANHLNYSLKVDDFMDSKGTEKKQVSVYWKVKPLYQSRPPYKVKPPHFKCTLSKLCDLAYVT